MDKERNQDEVNDKKDKKAKDRKANEKAELDYSGAPHDLVECVQWNGLDPLKPFILKKLSGLEFKKSPEFAALKSTYNHPETWTRETLYHHIFILQDEHLGAAFRSFLSGGQQFTVIILLERMMKNAKTKYSDFMSDFEIALTLVHDASLDEKHQKALKTTYLRYIGKETKKEIPLSDLQKCQSYRWWQEQKVKKTPTQAYSGAPFRLVECVHKHGIKPLKSFILDIVRKKEFMESKQFCQMKPSLTGTESPEEIYIDICMESATLPRKHFRDYLAKHVGEDSDSTIKVTMFFKEMIITQGTDYIDFMMIFHEVIKLIGNSGLSRKDRNALSEVFEIYWDNDKECPRELDDNELADETTEWERRTEMESKKQDAVTNEHNEKEDKEKEKEDKKKEKEDKKKEKEDKKKEKKDKKKENEDKEKEKEDKKKEDKKKEKRDEKKKKKEDKNKE